MFIVNCYHRKAIAFAFRVHALTELEAIAEARKMYVMAFGLVPMAVARRKLQGRDR